jgi:anti-anti-sigma factor
VRFVIVGVGIDANALLSGGVTGTAGIACLPGPPRGGALFSILELLGTQRHEFPRCRVCPPAAESTLADKKSSATDPPADIMTYSLTITTAPPSASVRVTGDLDYETTDDFVEAASRLLARNTMSELHVDFSELTFLDSAALSGLVLLHRRSSEVGVVLYLDHRPPFLDRVLQITGLFDHFDLIRSDTEIGDRFSRVG